MHQESLITEDIYEALLADIQALGGTKKVASLLWPDKTQDAAKELLRCCLNRTRAEKLDPEQVLFIIREARKAGSYTAIRYVADDAGFTRPEPIEPEDEAAALQREYITAVKGIEQISKRLERLSLPMRVARHA